MMKNRILVATDFSKSSLTSLTKAIYLAKKQKCPLDVVHIVEYSIFHNAKRDKKAGKEALAKFIAENFPDPEVEISQFCHVGSVHKEIHKHVAQRECSLLVIGATGETQHLTDALLGSVTKRVVKKAEIPVLITKDATLPDYANIFSPTDFSDNSLKTSKAVHKFFPNACLIFYYMILRPFETRLGHYGASEEQIVCFNKESEDKAKEASKKFLKKVVGRSEVVLDSGILSYTRLLSVAESKNASLVALHTSGKISFFALDVLQNSSVDVFICKF